MKIKIIPESDLSKQQPYPARQEVLEQKGIPPLPLISVVVFNDKGRLKRVRKLKREKAIVTTSRKAAGKIKRRLRFMETVLEEKDMDEIYRILKERAEVFRWVKKNHRKKVEKYKKRLD